jgi:hypothetical protein
VAAQLVANRVVLSSTELVSYVSLICLKRPRLCIHGPAATNLHVTVEELLD